MHDAFGARELLVRASAIFDETGNSLALKSRRAWRAGFHSGGPWMGLALAVIRGSQPIESAAHFGRLGFAKYGMAVIAAAIFIGTAIGVRSPIIGVIAIPAFYAVEAQMVFLFPLALDGKSPLFRESRQLTVRAGGTFAIMRIVLPLAAMMVLGGFIGKGFVRSWCLGCLAVCIWYEMVRPPESR